MIAQGSFSGPWKKMDLKVSRILSLIPEDATEVYLDVEQFLVEGRLHWSVFFYFATSRTATTSSEAALEQELASFCKALERQPPAGAVRHRFQAVRFV